MADDFREALVRSVEKRIARVVKGPAGRDQVTAATRRTIVQLRRTFAEQLVDTCFRQVGAVKVWVPEWMTRGMKPRGRK